MTLITDRTETLVLDKPEPGAAANLFFRRNEFHRQYRPVRDRAHAEWLLRSTTFDSPWVTILRGTPGSDSTYFQVLGTPDRLVAEGGGDIGTFHWNWRATALPGDYRTTTVGPAWYTESAYESDLITADDARRMLWFALANDLKSMGAAAGMEALYYQ